MNPDQIYREFFYNFCSRSDKFIKDFSFKFEGDFIVNAMQNFGPIHFKRDFSYKIECDFNFLVNFFFGPIFF